MTTLFDVSVVIPVFNEESVLPALFERLFCVLDQLSETYEVVFVDDGSCDRSPGLLRLQHQQRPQQVCVVFLRRNFGQHQAILAGFQNVRGRIIVTLDADLQNPPEEIPHLIATIKQGYDYVGTIRMLRQDSWLRRVFSRFNNLLRERLTGIVMKDQGCMLRAYTKELVDILNSCQESHTFVPALAYCFAARPTEIFVRHHPRVAGISKYSYYNLFRLHYDLITSFTTLPIRLYSILGISIAILSVFFVLYLGIRRLIVGPEVEGVFTLFGICFFLMGISLFGVGLIGEYVGRIYDCVRQRPPFVVANILQQPGELPLTSTQ